MVRLHTGDNRLNSHMHRKLKLPPSPTCPFGQEEQTTEHVLQRCPLYKTTREDLWPVSTSLTTKLYGCKQELKKTTSFISRVALIVETANAKKKTASSQWLATKLQEQTDLSQLPDQQEDTQGGLKNKEQGRVRGGG